MTLEVLDHRGQEMQVYQLNLILVIKTKDNKGHVQTTGNKNIEISVIKR